MTEEYISYLVSLDERAEPDEFWHEMNVELRFLWERDDMVLRNVQVLS